MLITPTKIPDVLIFSPTKHGDERGFFSELIKQDSLVEYGVAEVFTQDHHAYSAEPGVLRGLHYQAPPPVQDKLVRVVRGSIFNVAVDIRDGSAIFWQWSGVELSSDSWQQLLEPKCFAHGYLTLEPDTEVLYNVANPYAPQCDKGRLWSDPAIVIEWPIANTPILSAKDKIQPQLSEIPLEFTF